jgi:hypothetical protein
MLDGMPTITLRLRVAAQSHEAANQIQDIAERYNARLIRGYTPSNHDCFYETDGWDTAAFRKALTEVGFASHLQANIGK